jgi:hypothetical protein
LAWHNSCGSPTLALGPGLLRAGDLLNMNAYQANRCAPVWLVPLAAAAWLILPLATARAAEETFAVLQTKTAAYTNVTVTTKAKTYVFILHASGMTSLKVAELPPEVQEELGYAVAGSRKAATNTAAAWAKREIARIDAPQVKALSHQMEQKWRGISPLALSPQALLGSTVVWAVLGGTLLLYLFYCYCCMLICRKTGNKPGIMVWLPVLQIFPLLRAAGMSGWWFLAFLVPLLNLVPTILWPFKIAQARGKSMWVGVLLLLPVVSLFAFLYLAFSDGGPAEEDAEREPEVMSLQVA